VIQIKGIDPALVQEAIDAIQGRRTSTPGTQAQNYRGSGNGFRNGNGFGNGQPGTNRSQGSPGGAGSRFSTRGN
jgi:hypothetical protein